MVVTPDALRPAVDTNTDDSTRILGIVDPTTMTVNQQIRADAAYVVARLIGGTWTDTNLAIDTLLAEVGRVEKYIRTGKAT